MYSKLSFLKSPKKLIIFKKQLDSTTLSSLLSYFTTFRWLTHHYIISLPSIVPLDKDSNNGSNNNTFIYMQQGDGFFLSENFFAPPDFRFTVGNITPALIMMMGMILGCCFNFPFFF